MPRRSPRPMRRTILMSDARAVFLALGAGAGRNRNAPARRCTKGVNLLRGADELGVCGDVALLPLCAP